MLIYFNVKIKYFYIKFLKIIVYDNDDMVIICNTNNTQIDIKKEPLNQEFIFHSFGGAEGTWTPTVTRQILSLVRLPIPPQPQIYN